MAEAGDEETELRQRLLAGDAAAFSLWLNLHYDFIYRVAYRLLGQQMDAEDLTHDVCLSLPQKLKSYRGEGSVRAWLGQVTLNAGRDWLRKAKRRPMNELDESLPASQDTGGAVYAGEVLRAMAKLPEELRHTLVLVAEGLSYAEIALATATKEGTVAWRISTARTELAALLEGGRNAATG